MLTSTNRHHYNIFNPSPMTGGGFFLEICLTYLEAHHREVIVRFGAGAMGFYLGLQRIDDLPT